jgi:membrane protease YdiL (CAAX protease family)
MGTLIVFVMVDLLGIDPRLATGPLARAGVFERLVMSAGAGVHEELVFRLVMMGGILRLGERGLGFRRWAALALAIAISSVLFSAAHHVGPLGDPLRAGVFVYRALAGAAFALLFHFRGFALAVYTHTLYDVYVLLVRA